MMQNNSRKDTYGTFNYYVIKKCPKFGPTPALCLHLVNCGSPLSPLERSKLKFNTSPPPPHLSQRQ